MYSSFPIESPSPVGLFFSEREGENTLKGDLKIEHIILRWDLLKKEAILRDMDQILQFSQLTGVPPREKYLYRNSYSAFGPSGEKMVKVLFSSDCDHG